LIATGTDAAGAVRLADLVRDALESRAIPHAESVFGWVTLSAGVAVLVPGRESSSEQLLRLADEALYRAKAQGRNRTVLADDLRP
jgi:diguanylate cyclase (GGDEF)-like protein